MIGFLNKMEICGMIRIISSPLHKQNSFILHFIHGSITVKFGRGGSQLPFSERHICNSACKTWADMPLAAVWAVQLPTQTQFLWWYIEPQPLRPPLRPRALECLFFFWTISKLTSSYKPRARPHIHNHLLSKFEKSSLNQSLFQCSDDTNPAAAVCTMSGCGDLKTLVHLCSTV